MDTSEMKQYGNFTFKEVAIVSAIMGDCITKRLYKKVQRNNQMKRAGLTALQSNGHGYMVTIDIIGDWAIEFAKKHEKTNWEKVLENGIEPLSKEIKSIMCWDDACFDYAHFKFEQFKKRELSKYDFFKKNK